MDFTLPPALEDIRRRTAAFVDAHLIPLEADPETWDAHETIREEVLARMRDKARAAGLWAPQAPVERGGMGLPMVGRAAMYEAANRALFGPVTFNCAAPDDGNIGVLAKIGTAAQQARWLDPIIRGEVRSAFAMTEPHPGGGSDPGMMQTTAERRGDRWIVRGRKWFITGGEGAAHFIVVARTSDDKRRGLTAFLHHRDDPGWRVVRRVPIMGPEEHGGHCEIAYEGLEIPDENRLLEVGDGLKVTQIRLGPARLTHCMRWLGLARRSLEIARAYAAERRGFGVRLADRESVQIMLGSAAADIQIGRLLTMHAAWKLDQGGRARKEVSMAKVHVANALHRCVDIAIQINGARGYSKDTPLEWIYRYARQARLVDGADEVHRMVLSGLYEAESDGFWHWGAGDTADAP